MSDDLELPRFVLDCPCGASTPVEHVWFTVVDGTVVGATGCAGCGRGAGGHIDVYIGLGVAFPALLLDPIRGAWQS